MVEQQSAAVLDGFSLFDFLCGDWQLSRRIDDRHGGLTGQFDGRAVFADASQPGLLRYLETGTLRFGSAGHRAERRYQWRCEARDRAVVLFEDGRVFHHVDLRSGLAEVLHRCGDDLYRGLYTFETPDRWRLVWRVTGPRKAYEMESRFDRR